MDADDCDGTGALGIPELRGRDCPVGASGNRPALADSAAGAFAGTPSAPICPPVTAACAVAGRPAPSDATVGAVDAVVRTSCTRCASKSGSPPSSSGIVARGAAGGAASGPGPTGAWATPDGGKAVAVSRGGVNPTRRFARVGVNPAVWFAPKSAVIPTCGPAGI